MYQASPRGGGGGGGGGAGDEANKTNAHISFYLFIFPHNGVAEVTGYMISSSRQSATFAL